MNLKTLIGTAIIVAAISTSSQAAVTGFGTVTVDGTASGGFGVDPTNPGFGNFVAGPTFGGTGEQALITATGTVFLGASDTLPAGPDGIFFDLTGTNIISALRFAGGGFDGGEEPQSGALIGILVLEGQPTANPFSAAKGGDFNGADVFFLGESTLFTAPTAGQLFFGINDPRADNNSGAFSVVISEPGAVPVPAALPLMMGSLGFLALVGFRRRKDS